MKIYNLRQGFDFLLILLLVMSSGGLLFVFHRNNMSYILLGLAFFSCFFLGSKLKKSIFNASLFTLLLSYSLVLINYYISSFIGNQTFLKYGFHLLNITSCVIVITHFRNNRDMDNFLISLRFVLLFILFHSILNFLGYFVFKGSLSYFEGEHHAVDTFNFLFFYDIEKHQYTISGLSLIRNQGMFWEPGILQIYLNILLFLEGFIFQRNRWIILLLVFSIFTTYSTTGIVIMILVLLFIFHSDIKKNPLFILVAIFSIFPVYYVAKTNIERKVEGEKSSSFQKRWFDLKQPLAIAYDHPLTGVGLDIEHFQKFRKNYYLEDEFGENIEERVGIEAKAETTSKGSSNSITFLMAAMGFPISFFLIYCLFKQKLIYHRKGIFMSIFIISVFSEPLLLRPFFLTFIISGMMSFFYKFTNYKYN